MQVGDGGWGKNERATSDRQEAERKERGFGKKLAK